MFYSLFDSALYIRITDWTEIAVPILRYSFHNPKSSNFKAVILNFRHKWQVSINAKMTVRDAIITDLTRRRSALDEAERLFLFIEHYVLEGHS